MNILIVEDDPQQAENLSNLLESLSNSVRFYTKPLDGLRVFEKEDFDLSIVDMKMPTLDGMGFLKKALEMKPEARIVMLTAYGTIETAVEAMKKGAFDFLVKPAEEIRLNHVLKLVEDAVHFARMAKLSAPEGPEEEAFLAVSPTMRKVKDLIRRVASLTTTVMIHGETGTGKELVAQAIHSNSPRKDKPFIAVNCANLVGNLLESELFGHEKGAFTGADSRKLGKFELASGGTLFLDEVAEIPTELQPKLLRAIQEQEIERVGGTKTVRVDVRIVSATNRNLSEMAENGSFRKDLFYRINVFPLKLPALRERREDIPVLAQSFLKEFALAHGRPQIDLENDGVEWLKEQSWPGNIRELRNILERAVIVDDDGKLGADDFRLPSESKSERVEEKGTFIEIVEERERATLLRALEKHNGNVVAASKDLGLARRTFYDKMKKLGVDPVRFRQSG